MKRRQLLRIYRSIPWLVFGVVLMPAVATFVVGILLIALWDAPGDLALGILTLVFAVFVVTGGILSLTLLLRQNRLLRAQESFIANVSHELRTPLASIRMCAETLKLGRFDNEDEHELCLRDLEHETRRLTLLVEQLLGVRGRSSMSRGTILPEDAAERALSSFRRNPEHAQRLSLMVEPALPALAVDAESLHEALCNLIDNALKHGEDGPVVVTVRAERRGVAFAVRDSGPGIEEQDLERLFQRFERGERALEQGIPGLGLGLSIVQACAREHGGQLSASPAAKRGLIVTLYLPAEEEVLERQAHRPEAQRLRVV
ncbi:MAG: HAMP domain-containing sensor histidine kinase [Myxococcota bacterium]|nr:HAMP domain-containing sensor histidine kinase [Myxococcota bacterium]